MAAILVFLSLSTLYQRGSVILFNPLAVPSRHITESAWIEVDHLLQKYWCHMTIYYCIKQILL